MCWSRCEGDNTFGLKQNSHLQILHHTWDALLHHSLCNVQHIISPSPRYRLSYVIMNFLSGPPSFYWSSFVGLQTHKESNNMRVRESMQSESYSGNHQWNALERFLEHLKLSGFVLSSVSITLVLPLDKVAHDSENCVLYTNMQKYKNWNR